MLMWRPQVDNKHLPLLFSPKILKQVLSLSLKLLFHLASSWDPPVASPLPPYSVPGAGDRALKKKIKVLQSQRASSKTHSGSAEKSTTVARTKPFYLRGKEGTDTF